jgi:hypothetical protein
MVHNAAEINAFAALGVGVLAFVRLLDGDDVLAMIPGADVKPHDVAIALIDAAGEPILLRGSLAECLIAAAERELCVVSVH